MKHKNRDYLKPISLAGESVCPSLIAGCNYAKGEDVTLDNMVLLSEKSHNQRFNMCDYGTEPIPTVHIGLVGLGNREPGAIRRRSCIEGVEIKAVCNVRSEKVQGITEILEGNKHKPEQYSNGPDGFKNICQWEDIGHICVATP